MTLNVPFEEVNEGRVRLRVNKLHRVSADGNFDIINTEAIVSECGVWMFACFLICSDSLWISLVEEGSLFRLIINLTRAQLGHWSNVVTFL